MTANAITKTFHYDGDLVTYVTQSDGKVYRFAYDHSGRPIFISYNNNQYWYHYDQHGSVIRMTDKDGKTVAKYKYDAWGNSTYKWGTTGTGSEIVNLNPYRYSGYWYDSEIDKYYLKARYYDAGIGRFLAKDPIAVRVGDSLSLNAYSYTGNNPVMFVDPSGEILAAIIAGALIGMTIYGELYLWSTRNGGGTVSGFAEVVIEGGVTGAATVVVTESVIGAVSKYALKSTKLLKNASIVKGAGKVDILSNKTLTNQTGKVNNYVSNKKGFNAAKADFDALKPNNVRTYPNGTTVGELPNGNTINVRTSSSGGYPTVEIYDHATGISIKIRY